MCRLLAVGAAAPFEIGAPLTALADIARHSPEYQGDGWGCAWWDDDEATWRCHHSIRPIWDDRWPMIRPTRRLLAHARSAFHNEDIAIENNMPFVENATAFVFNGELRGVRLAVNGRIGAEKLFRFVQRLGGDRDATTLARATDVVSRRTGYVRAMNFVLATKDRFLVASRFGENPEYFTMHQSTAPGRVVVSSAPYPGEVGWGPIANGAVFELAVPC